MSQAGVRAEELRPYSPTWSDYHLQVRAEWLHTCNEEAIVKTYKGFMKRTFKTIYLMCRHPLPSLRLDEVV